MVCLGYIFAENDSIVLNKVSTFNVNNPLGVFLFVMHPKMTKRMSIPTPMLKLRHCIVECVHMTWSKGPLTLGVMYGPLALVS